MGLKDYQRSKHGTRSCPMNEVRKSISNGVSKWGKTSKNERNPSPMVLHFWKKKWGYEHPQRYFDVNFFYLHNGLLLFDNLYFMHKQNINTKHDFYNFISNMYILIKLLKI